MSALHNARKVYLTSLQAEVEAKVRGVHRFRKQMQQLNADSSPRVNGLQRETAARALIAQVGEMLKANHIVRELLEDLRAAAQAVLEDFVKT